MRTAVIYGVLAGLGVVSSLQGCSCKSDDTDESTPDAAVPDGSTPSPEAGAPDGSACLDQDPPAGFSTISDGAGKQGNYGVHVSMTLDDKGSPMVAFVHWGPDGGSDGKTSVLYFTRWDRCTATWSTPVNVATVSAIGTDATARQVSIARDASNGAIGIAFNRVTADGDNGYNEVYFAQSTDQGATWSSGVVSDIPPGDEGEIHNTNGPGLAMAGGKAFIAYAQESVLCTDVGQHCDGKYAEGTPGNWTRTVLPNLAGGFGASLGAPVIVQLDSDSKPAVAYIVAPETGSNAQIAFWRPGTAAAVKVLDSNGVQNDSPSLAMLFEGDKPRLVAQLLTAQSGSNNLLFARSNDGLTWDPPITLPHDGDEQTAFAQALALGPNGSFAVAAEDESGSGTEVCGAPKISRSTDDGSTWTTCGADTTKMLTGVGGRFVQAAFSPTGKLMVAFQVSTNDSDPIKSGVAIWREP